MRLQTLNIKLRNKLSHKCGDPDADVETEVALQMAESRYFYNQHSKTFNYTIKLVTDLQFNHQLKYPDAVEAIEETEIKVGHDMYIKEFNSYINNNCNKEGKQQSNQTSA